MKQKPKIWYRVLLISCLLGTITATLAKEEETSLDPVSPLRNKTVLIDSLFNVGAFDSIISRIPPLIDDAHARGDSTFLANLLISRGRVELTHRNTAKAGSTFSLV